MKELISLVADLFTAPFRKDTVAGLTASMEAQVDRLFNVATRELAAAETAREKAAAIVAKAESHEDEARRAERIAARFANLIR